VNSFLVLTRLADGLGKEGSLPDVSGYTPKIGSPAAADAALSVYFFI
jgi:hypothetical protein